MNALFFNTIPRKGDQYPDMDHADKIYLLPHTKFLGKFFFHEIIIIICYVYLCATYLLTRLFAIKTWWLEKDHFKYGTHAYNNLTAVGHYTQLVWAATHRVGCGLNTCEMRQNGKVVPYFTYICNYCPM